jgi:hypothetical protein
VHWIAPIIERLDDRLGMGDDWLAFSRFLQRERPFTALASDYWAANCYAGISPFTAQQIPMDDLVGKDGDQSAHDGFSIGADRSMFGVDYPHFETIFGQTAEKVAELVCDPSVTDDDARGVLYGNAAAVYGFDLDALAPTIDRIGFDLSEVSAPTAA